MNYQKGNYILTEYGELPIKHVVFDQYQVTGLDGRILWAKKVEPIELTEEWLIKLGFELNYKSNFSITYGHIENNKFSYKFNIPENKSWLEYHGGAINCKYVHQLQNLYFCLTGTELTINK